MSWTVPDPAVGTVAVPGGRLAYEVLAGSSRPVLAVHGISSHRRLWLWLRRAAPEVTLVAPDLRGRADSVAVQGPSSPERHADDLALLLDHLGLDRVPVLGMSMGGFVALHLADRHPDRVASVVLVDGGFPLQRPPGLTEQSIEAAFADRLARLGRPWESVDDYLDYFCSSTAPLLDRDDPLLRHYVEHDLRDGRVRLSGAALVGDATRVFLDGVPWQDVDVPVRFLHAEWSVGADSAPAYPPEAVERYAGAARTVVGLDGVDHAGSIMSRPGAEATATLVREALAEDGS
jgi:pimeloyl-ACP methyl ester carboxylesterase